MKLISFLGLGKYEVTIYTYAGKEKETCYVVEALAEFFPEVNEVLVVLTPSVENPPPGRERHWDEVQRRLSDKVKPLGIPESHSEQALWDIFNRLMEAVQPEDEVIFDITHSFRSLPFLTFLAIAYLRAARKVKVVKVLYGAFDAQTNGRSPVFDLTPFVGLLDWLNAANQFIYTGDARYLAHVLQSEGKTRQSSALVKAAEELQKLSLAMMLCRPLEVMENAGKLGVVLERARDDLAQKAQPFTLLTERIEREYAQRALPDPKAEGNLKESLRQQLQLIAWYVENNQIIQAMSLAREWLITLVAWRLGMGFVIEVKAREELAWGIEGLSRFLENRLQACELNEVAWKLRDMEKAHQTALSHVWGRLSGLRNDLDHVGMSPSASPAHRLERRAKEEILPALKDLAVQWMLVPTEESKN